MRHGVRSPAGRESTGHRLAPPTKSRASPHALTRMAVVLLMGAASVACGEDPPEPPRDETCPAAQVRLCSDPGAAAIARDGIADAAARSTLGLENATARSALAGNLGQLGTQLAAHNVTQSRAALAATRESIATARGQLSSFPGDAADLASIELMLDFVAALL
jgi:hypothetical protein